MNTLVPSSTTDLTWLYYAIAGIIAVFALLLWILVSKSRRLPGDHVFQASRWSRGNRLFPPQVVITPESITLHQPQWIGREEESIHMAHVASIKIDTNMIFSDVYIETTGGKNPIVCHGHTKNDAVEMKRVIEQFQSAQYRKG